MDEYIDRKGLRKALYDADENTFDGLDIIDNYPAADVQPVVRCKDCKHFHLNYFEEVNGVNIIVAHEICDFWAGGCRTTQDTFCSKGARMDGGKNG